MKKLVVRDLPLNPAPLYFLLCLITPTPYGSVIDYNSKRANLYGLAKNN